MDADDKEELHLLVFNQEAATKDESDRHFCFSS